MKRNYDISHKQNAELDRAKNPTVLDIAWAAGIYEGEGSCVSSGYKNRSFVASVSQKDPEFLYRLRDLFGGSVRQQNTSSEKRYLIYYWTCCGDRGRVFLASIYPFLTSRRKAQIESVEGAWKFLSTIPDLLSTEYHSVESKTYFDIWQRVNDLIGDNKEKRREHKQQKQKAYDQKRRQSPEWKEQHNASSRKWKQANKLKQKEQQSPKLSDNLITMAS